MKAMRPKQRVTVSIIRLLGWAAAALIAVWLLSVTLRPGKATNELNLAPFSQKVLALQCVLEACRGQVAARRFLYVDVLGNIAAFVPLGAALALAVAPTRLARRRRPSMGWPLWAGLLGGLFSVGIELAQLNVPGRATDVDDVILNTVGALAGAGLIWFVYTNLRGRHD